LAYFHDGNIHTLYGAIEQYPVVMRTLIETKIISDWK
jgi:hypothetical protein